MKDNTKYLFRQSFMIPFQRFNRISFDVHLYNLFWLVENETYMGRISAAIKKKLVKKFQIKLPKK